MIGIVLTYFYISLICYTYGDLLSSRFDSKQNKDPDAEFNFILKCFIGLAWVGILFTAISLLLPLGGWVAQLMLLFPCICWWFVNKTFFYQFLESIKQVLFRTSGILSILKYSCILF